MYSYNNIYKYKEQEQKGINMADNNPTQDDRVYGSRYWTWEGTPFTDPAELTGVGVEGYPIESWFTPVSYDTGATLHDRRDNRVRLSLPPGAKNMFYNNKKNWLLEPLRASNGVVFPFVPQIVINNTASYSSMSPAHTNYAYQVYQNSSVGTINVFGQFTAQTVAEAEYVLAVITFMRLVTKSFRNDDPHAGNPPITLRLSGHGQNILPNVPVVITSFDLTLPREVDYITIGTDNVPTMTDVSITMMPVYSRDQLSKFSMKDIATGQMISDKGGFL